MQDYDSYPYSIQNIENRIAQYEQQPLKYFTNEQQSYRFLINCIDLTTLEGSDNKLKIGQLCGKAKSMIDVKRGLEGTAAVCVYPLFIAQCKELLAYTPIKVASVAGAFPAGQSPLHIKISEVRYALEEGADEIDMVISRGKFLEGNYQEVFDEIATIKHVCGEKTLKVILETGELGNYNNIYIASQLAIEAGADFIKTSTGKISVNATPQSFLVMLDAIAEHYKETGQMVAIKPAGGIADAETAILFLKILENVLGEKWLNNRYFRIGASRLVDKLMSF
jgi:deoxyribose-phosphate aldolase